MEALQIIVPFLGVILGIFIGYFLKQSEYQRQRRVAIYDKRIQEAQTYLETYKKAFYLLVNIEREMLSNPDVHKDETDPLEKLLIDSSNWTPKKLASIDVLNDTELNELRNKLVSNFNSEVIRAFELRRNLLEKKDIDRDPIYDRLIKLIPEYSELVIEMQLRLDKLTENVP